LGTTGIMATIILLNIGITASPELRAQTTLEYDAGKVPGQMAIGSCARVRDDFSTHTKPELADKDLEIDIVRHPGGNQHVSVVDRCGGGSRCGGCDGGPDRVAQADGGGRTVTVRELGLRRRGRSAVGFLTAPLP
jgi:hypothetical protein